MALFSIETYGELQPHLKQEWLVTNGLGGFAASTVVGCNTRRYHGLLCAATLPPVGRIMGVSRVGEILELDGKTDHPLEFSINQFGPGDNFHPRGQQYLQRFDLEEECARWVYDIDGVIVTKELQMLWRQNATAVRYTLAPDRPNRTVKLRLLPFLTLRDFHMLRRGTDAGFRTDFTDTQVTVADAHFVTRISVDQGHFVSSPAWWYGHYYAVESERGMDDREDSFTPGYFELATQKQATTTLWMSLGTANAASSSFDADWDRQIALRRSSIAATRTAVDKTDRADSIRSVISETDSDNLKRLAHAANDFIVLRKARDGTEGTTVIAGYPWFADWGRDTMISLPGLFLATGRFTEARQVLGVFADYVSEGMIPNRFDDYTNEPHYNTVDASLWFIHACHEYLRLSRDQSTFSGKLLPACRAIIDGYRKGTRFHIGMDPADSLICQGDPSTQLTWMDAKCGEVCFTPRQGKPVEINALWYHALVLLGETELAAKVSESFRASFCISPFRGLCDVIDGSRRDTSIRPNQIFAVSLPNTPLSHDQQRAVVEVVRRELLTPLGLRTLSPSDPGYRGRYTGPVFDRDGAYHNGTVWPWLIGPFLSAYLRVNDRSEESIEQARRWLQPLIDQMHTVGIGQLSEICDGDEPHRAVGCPAQAWSVAEVLRVALEVGL